MPNMLQSDTSDTHGYYVGLVLLQIRFSILMYELVYNSVFFDYTSSLILISTQCITYNYPTAH